jgi:hypothetical protein
MCAEYGGFMMIFIAFLAGFYIGAFAVSLLIVAGRKKKVEKEENYMLEQPHMQQMVLF